MSNVCCICKKCIEFDEFALRIDDEGFLILCEDCIEKISYVHKKRTETNNSVINYNFKPKDVYQYLNDRMVGQDEAKKVISIAIYNHFKRMNNSKIEKSNVLLLGPSGTGKTLLIKLLAKALNLPFVIADATRYSEVGYVGENVEDILKELVKKANNDVKKAEKGIIYLDEIDKINSTDSNSRDVSGRGVQQALLKLIEGNELTVVEKTPYGNNSFKINTSNILFICGGAFNGIKDIVSKRININNRIGFSDNIKEKNKYIDIYSNITTKDLLDFGLEKELIGRLPIVTYTNELSIEDLVHILSDVKNSIISQYIELFRMDNVELSFDEKALECIARLAYENETGARGLRTIIEKVLKDLMFEANSSNTFKDITITEDYVLSSLNYEVQPMLMKNC